ncbi:MAG: hypothetical protein AUJ52_07850 [Elusimicrobia bacterium CG1_02_63_36]|nr:MAG: hypothetical protein AUJ52_07850 [Elusimicrobia bacterium CG1_02_63_36]PIP82902.1 MAG: hypothetical protein COR54_12435 [Elusimicrobia bacterium CG22_combo_CG10-13_8_21_14_all_63_91]PJA15918.1 MAG: hypothetical protein COX66_08770 [Elusimicrobia bacterium CG_4_10_14_0_2_um_filter_63_34]PJB25008.1 MAG: hypothetical protein CO113_10945 [Elusimicrobia bacterium CG_4_9_14_3_um_filter_62_55]
MGLSEAIKKVRSGELTDGTGLPSPGNGSNAHAVAPWRSADGIARLNVNSHLDWEGFRAWQEAHVVSEEGWNFSGGYLAATPFLLIGHNDRLGWTLTVNRPDLVDVYAIERDPSDPSRYRFDGESKPLEEKVARIRLEWGPFSWTLKKRFYRTLHGPALEARGGLYAFRVAGLERAVFANEELYDMNKASSFEEFKGALSRHAIGMFNVVYADAGNILYQYNALIPERAPGFDWKGVVPGNTSKTLWGDYLPLASLPRVENPASGWLQNCNATPYATTSSGEIPDPADIPVAAGIETYANNRTLRSHETFGSDESITREEFLSYKWDRRYSRRAPLYARVIEPLLDRFVPVNAHERRALKLLRTFDGRLEPESRTAALVIKTYGPIYDKQYEPEKAPDPRHTFRQAVAWLVRTHGRVDPRLDEVQFISRGAHSFPVAGGPSVLHVVDRHRIEDGKLVGTHGDGFLQIVEFPKGKPARATAVHQFGASSRPNSPHYADQMESFAARRLRPSWRTREEILADLESRYRP